jgi:peroxiredoxin
VRGFGIGHEFRGFTDVAQRSAFLIEQSGIVRNAWRYETGDVPDVEEWIQACTALQSAT